MIAWLGALILAACPGCWITLMRGGRGARRAVDAATAIALAPAVLAAQFIAFRLVGAEAKAIAIWLVALNLLAIPLTLIAARTRRAGRPRATPPRAPAGTPATSRVDIIAYAIVAIVTLASFGPRLTDVQDRAFSGHAWMHADTCYQLAQGSLDPEESLLAGVRQSFPWLGHVYPTLVGLLVDRPPMVVYFWLNLVSLLAAAILIAAAARNLSSRPLVGPVAIALLLFGVNVVGFWLAKALPASLVERVPVFGDPRYTPWLLKYAFFNQMPIAFAALAVIVERATRAPERGEWLVPTAALACVGLIYPMLAPVAGTVLALRVVTMLRSGERRAGYALAVGLVVVAAGSWLHLDWVTAARGDASAIGLSTLRAMARKTGDAAMAFAPLAAALWFGRRHVRGAAARTLALSGAAALLAYVVLHLPFWRNEYKFVFGAALCFAPLAAARTPLPARGKGLALVTLLTLALASPMAMKTYGHPQWGPTERPSVNLGRFAIHLTPRHEWAQLCETTRRGMGPGTVLIAEDPPIHLPTLTRHTLWAPLRAGATYDEVVEQDTPPFGRGQPGLNLDPVYLVNAVRGYDRALLNERARAMDLFRPDTTADARRERVRAIRASLGYRTVLLAVDLRRHAALDAWLRENGDALEEYRGPNLALWQLR